MGASRRHLAGPAVLALIAFALAVSVPPALAEDAPVVSGVSPGAGTVCGGTAVSITGTGFTGATAVDFGPVTPAATFSVLSDGEISAVSPPGDSIVDVTVTTAAGTSALNGSDVFSYTGAPGLPCVISVSPASGPAAGATSVAIDGTGFTGATGVSFGATAASSFSVTSDSEIEATSAAGSGTVDVTVTNAAGDSPTSSADQFTYTEPPADLVVTAVSGPASAEVGESIHVSWTVQNQGDSTEEPGWSDTVYLSSSDVDFSDATKLGSVTHSTSLDADSSYTQEESVTIPSARPPGPAFLLVVNNASGTFGSFASSSIAITPALPVVTIAVAEQISASDAEQAEPPVSITDAESVSVSDQTQVSPPVSITDAESVSVSDQTQVSPPASISDEEGIVIHD